MMGVIPARLLSYIEGNATNGTYEKGNITIESAYTLPGGKTVPNINGQQSYTVFDYIVGTSTGGLLASALSVTPLDPSYTKPLTANEALAFYCNNASNLFPGSVSEYQMLTGSTTSFGNTALANAIAGLYGAPSGAMSLDRKSGITVTFTPTPVTNPFSTEKVTVAGLASAESPVTVLITSFNNNLPQTPITGNPLQFNIPVVNSIDENTTPPGPIMVTNTTTSNGEPLSVLQACLMTSAFPMLLPPVPYDLQFGNNKADQGTVNYFLDGGIYAGNPALAAYFYALENNLTINSFISIGCGAGALPTGLNYSTVKTWGGELTDIVNDSGWMNIEGRTPLLNLLQHGPGLTVDALLGELLPGKFFRLDPSLPQGTTYPAWSSDPAAIKAWIAAADSLVETLNTLTLQDSPTTLWQNMIHTIQGIS